jgi:hypothetical protein
VKEKEHLKFLTGERTVPLRRDIIETVCLFLEDCGQCCGRCFRAGVFICALRTVRMANRLKRRFFCAALEVEGIFRISGPKPCILALWSLLDGEFFFVRLFAKF